MGWPTSGKSLVTPMYFFFSPHRNTFNCCIDNSDLPLRSTKKQ